MSQKWAASAACNHFGGRATNWATNVVQLNPCCNQGKPAMHATKHNIITTCILPQSSIRIACVLHPPPPPIFINCHVSPKPQNLLLPPMSSKSRPGCQSPCHTCSLRGSIITWAFFSPSPTARTHNT
jgi:hypothetical protein